MRGAASGAGVGTARRLIADEVRRYLAAQRSAEVTPTVTALRRRAAEVVDAEMLRLATRLPGLPQEIRAELSQAVHRVVEKLLHTSTVRIEQLAQGPAGDAYAEALRELFALDPQARPSSPRRRPVDSAGQAREAPAIPASG